MSTTLSTTQMVAQLQRRVPIGLSSVDGIYFLNEAFRKIDQMSQGGFIWQFKVSTISLAIGAFTPTPPYLPADFDPGKTAVLRGTTNTPTITTIPYKPYKDFVDQEHFLVSGVGNFACWTFIPFFAAGPPTSYQYRLGLAPAEAFPLSLVTTLTFGYHAMTGTGLTIAPNVYFPTPDQFDSLILDLAEAEARRIYTLSGWEKIASQATAAVQEMIGTYRSDRADLAGMADQAMQAQEKATERTK